MDLPAGLVIRTETVEDAPAIASVVGSAFGSETEVRLVEAIRRGEGYLPALALVAELEREVIGHVMVSGAVLVDGETSHVVATLSPLAVAPTHQRRGVGSALVRTVLERAEAVGEPLVVLEGSPAYYSRFGFEPSAAHGITIDLPSWAPAEAAQVIKLGPSGGGLRGHLRFAALDEVGDRAAE